MDKLVYIYYPVLLVLLFFGAKVYKKKEWNEGALSLSQTKAIQGFVAIGIMFHHLSQETAASWIPRYAIHRGLDFFVNMGYYFVGIFMFCSGYGLYKSFMQKEDYLKGFFKKRFLPILLVFFVTELIFAIARFWKGIFFGYVTGAFANGYTLVNPYSWYIYAIVFLYLGFYISFRFCKNKNLAILFTGCFVVAYMIWCSFTGHGEWWYNTAPFFLFGMLFSKREETIIRNCKKLYWLLLPVTLILAYYCNRFAEVVKMMQYTQTKISYPVIIMSFVCVQVVGTHCFVAFMILLSMKVQIGNKVLAFFGTMTLEFYLIHGFFVQLFGYSFIEDSMKPVFYVKNVFLYVLLVTVCSVLAAWLLRMMNGLIKKNLKQ